LRALAGPRFGVEATFIIVVAIVAGLLELSLAAIVGAVFGAWALVAVAELVASRRAARRRAVGPAPVAIPAPPPPPAPLSAPRAPEPEPVELEPEPEPATAADEAEPEPPEPEPLPEPEPVPFAAERPALAVVAPPPPAPVLAEEPEPEPAPEPARVVALRPPEPREWNVWELERLLQAKAGAPLAAGDEQGYLLLYLREYANADGVLPVEFDSLVRESFGDVIGVEG
jgi:hypothetical protein